MLDYHVKMIYTYNLDAASPRITNKKSSHIICGKAEKVKSDIFVSVQNTTVILLLLISNADKYCHIEHVHCYFQCETGFIRYVANMETNLLLSKE